MILEEGWQKDLTDFEKEQLTILKYRLERHLKAFHQIEQTVFVALLDDKGKVLWIEPYLAQEISRSLADIPAVREVFQSGQVYLEVEETLITGDSPTLSLVVPIKDDQEVEITFVYGDNDFSQNNPHQILIPDYDIETGVIDENNPEVAVRFTAGGHGEVIFICSNAACAGHSNLGGAS